MGAKKPEGRNPIQTMLEDSPVMKAHEDAPIMQILAMVKHEIGNAFVATEQAELLCGELAALTERLHDLEGKNLQNPNDEMLREIERIRIDRNKLATRIMHSANIIWNRIHGDNRLTEQIDTVRDRIRHEFFAVLKQSGL